MTDPYADFREAIRSNALVRASEHTIIIRAESQPNRDAWIFDFRALMLQPRWLNRYAEIFWEKYADRYPFQVGGMETAAIPLISAIVMKGVERGTPVNGFYLRKSRKRNGLMKQVEGTITEEPIVLVDDLSNTSYTLTKQLDVLVALGKRVSDMFVMVVFRRREAYAAYAERGVRFSSLFTLDEFGIPLIASREPAHRTFKEIWRFASPHPIHHHIVQKSAPLLHRGLVLFGCDDGVFRALDERTGAIAWEFSVGRHPYGKGILSSPAAHGELVYFGAYDGVIYALESATGSARWKYDDADWIGSSPALAPEHNLLYIGLEFGLFKKRGGIVALDMRTGNEVWRAIHPELTHASPLYIPEESLVVIGCNDGALRAYDAKSGALRWQYSTRGEIKTTCAYDARRRIIVFGGMDGNLHALDARTGSPARVIPIGTGMYSIPLIHDDTVYVASLDKCLYAFNLDSWKKRWEFETNGRIFSSSVMYDGSIWIGSNDGRLYELDPARGELRGFFQTTERVTNKIAVNETNGRMYVPTSANEIYCIERAD